MQSKAPGNWLFRIALAVNLGLAIAYLLLGVIAFQQGLLWRADFTAFYTGGLMVREDAGKQLYDYELQTRFQQELLQGKSFYEGLLPFNYPPHVALLFAPLAHFSRSTAFAVGLVVQFGLLLWLLKNLLRLSKNWLRTEKILLISGVLGFFPLFLNMLLGAFSLFVVDCLLAWYLALKEQREARSGLWLVTGSVKPQTVIIPGLVLFFGRRWRAILAITLGGLGLMLFTAIFLGVDIWADFIRILRLSSSFFDEYGIYPSEMYNLKGTLALWLGNSHKSLINTISLAGFLLAIGVTAWLWRGPWQPTEPDFELRLAVTLILGILLGMHVNPQDSLLLVMPALLFYEYLRRMNLPRKTYGVFLWACLPLFLVGEFSIQARLGIRLPVVAMLVLFGWSGKALWDRR
ncbi:MAG: glycosyltransferase family 87 protein [Chloroflexota bacterium]